MEALIQQAKEGCEISFNTLLNDNQRAVNYFKGRYRDDDVKSYCYQGIYWAIQSYDFYRGDFGKHVFNVMNREVNNEFVKKPKAQKRDGITLSFQHPVNDTQTLRDRLGKSYDFDANLQRTEYLKLLYRKLNLKQRKVLSFWLRYQDMPNEELGRFINVTKARIGQIKSIIIEKFQRVLRDEQLQINLIEAGVI